VSENEGEELEMWKPYGRVKRVRPPSSPSHTQRDTRAEALRAHKSAATTKAYQRKRAKTNERKIQH